MMLVTGLLVSMLMSIFSNLSFCNKKLTSSGILKYHEYAVQGQQLLTGFLKLTLQFDWNQAIRLLGLPAITQPLES